MSVKRLILSRAFAWQSGVFARSVATSRCLHFSASSFQAKPIAAPQPDNAEKVYSANIQNIVDQICKLSLIEVSELNELLKKSLNIDDSQLVSHVVGAPAGVAAKAEEADEPKETRTSFTVKLVKIDDTKKVPAIKAVKSLIEGMNLVQAKKFVESAPQVLRADIGKEEADKIKKLMEEAGAAVEIV